MVKQGWAVPGNIKLWIKNYGVFLLLILLGLTSRLFWIAYTHFTEEDAFITFRIARHLAEGVGFVYNSGERVLGTTSPLFTLLLAGWMTIVSKNVMIGAKIFNLVTSISSLIFLLMALREIGASKAQQTAVLMIFACSVKLIVLEVGGMETSLVLFLMIASWYTYLSGRLVWTSIILGLLILTRLDLFIWPFAMLLIEMISSPKHALRMGMIASLVVFPWIIFSSSYFGSPIPHTIDAKWVAYVQNNHTPFSTHLWTIANFMSPFSQFKDHILLRDILSWTTLLIVTWQSAYEFGEKKLALPVVFILLDIPRLVFTRATFFNRYFAPLLVVVFILLGLGLGNLWGSAKYSSRRMKAIYTIALITLAGMGLVFAGYETVQTKMKQEFRYEKSLMRVGLWLNQNSTPSARVLLEPLGYIGYYADRTMIDEVGLVSPEVVTLKKQGVSANDYFLLFMPDYYVLHCDDALRLQDLNRGTGLGLADHFTRRVSYNPLNFDIQQPDYSDYGALQRNSCYEVWQRNGE
jgi:hypothetical protein